MAENEITKIFVVDDHPLFRKGVVQLLQLNPNFQVIGEAGTFEAAVAGITSKEPDLVLLDLNMKGTSGIEILSAIKKHDPSIKVVMLTVSDSPNDLLQAIKTGADGYLLKDLEPEEILENINRAIEGQVVLSPVLTNALAEALKEKRDESARSLQGLTEKELMVLKGVSQGLSNKLIARELNISDGTVKVHVKHILKKLNFHSRV
ncbi:two-component system response regulator NarL, partial [Turicimonas muris]